MRQREFQSLDEYYEDDPRRERSGELDYGVQWTERMQIFPRWRVSWVEATGEFYAYNELNNDDGRLVVIGIAATREDAERVMEGWDEECGKSGSLNWIAHQLLHTLPEKPPTSEKPEPEIILF
jgi:hypothetical protein